ncbi:MAG: tetratricopeptide repeat protein [Myxococcota bacterium]|nr:tetratricopeptide repeat protein [Myxococcota bacterium]
MFHHHILLGVLGLLLVGCSPSPTAQSTSPSEPAADSLQQATPPPAEADEFIEATDAMVATPADDDQTEHEACPEEMTESSILTAEWIPHHDARYRDHYNEAVLLLEEERSDEAVNALRMALFDSPDSSVTWLLLGETYLDLGREQQALTSVREALVHEPDFPDAHFFIAEFELSNGAPSEARHSAERLVRLRPDDPSASHLLARVYMGLAMWKEAIATCRTTIRLDPEYTRAYNNLGFSALQIGQNELALQYLTAAAELPGVQAYLLNNLGIAQERTGATGDAIRSWRRALELQPGFTRAAVNMDRLQRVVDAEVADELARILAGRDADELEGPSTASADTETTTEGDIGTP